MTLRTLIRPLVIAASLLALQPAQAQAPDDEQAFVTRFQQALRTNDKQWVADHTRYPLRVHAAKASKVASKAALLRRYNAIFTPKVKAAVLAQEPAKVFRNWQGTMIGEGATNVWARSEDDQPELRIITVNNR